MGHACAAVRLEPVWSRCPPARRDRLQPPHRSPRSDPGRPMGLEAPTEHVLGAHTLPCTCVQPFPLRMLSPGTNMRVSWPGCGPPVTMVLVQTTGRPPDAAQLWARPPRPVLLPKLAPTLTAQRQTTAHLPGLQLLRQKWGQGQAGVGEHRPRNGCWPPSQTHRQRPASQHARGPGTGAGAGAATHRRCYRHYFSNYSAGLHGASGPHQVHQAQGRGGRGVRVLGSNTE